VAFNSTATFNQLNANINLNVKDTLILKIINTDSVKHVFSIRDYAGYLPLAINPNDSATDTLHFSSVQAHIFYDAYQYPTYKYLGAAGILSVTKNAPSAKEFYWNIKEHQSSYHQKLAQNIPVNWASYQPDYYTVNALSFPDLKDDTTHTWIHGKMGDTLYVFFANTGQTTHGIHLHGYHATIIYSKHSDQIGWIKDTFP
jgi:hypothetical protein